MALLLGVCFFLYYYFCPYHYALYSVFYKLPARVVLWSPLLTSKLVCHGSSPGRTSTQDLKIIEEKGCLYIDISKL